MQIHGVRRATSFGLAGLGLAFLVSALPPTQLMRSPSAVAATPANGCAFILWGAGTGTLNYDQTENDTNCNEDVDWAVNIVFYNGASINNVKSALNYNYSDVSNNDMFLVGRDGGVSFTDDDKGRKRITCPVPGDQTRHYRVYADSDDYLFSLDWGPFVVATTHWDANECPPIGTRYYGSEETEQHMASNMEADGHDVYRNYMNLSNNEPYRVEGDHTWESNGLATAVDMAK